MKKIAPRITGPTAVGVESSYSNELDLGRKTTGIGRRYMLKQ